MRAVVRGMALVSAVIAGLLPASSYANEWQITPHLARVQGILLFVLVEGKPPCDFVKERLLTSAKFVLNSSGIPFDDQPETNEGEDRSSWGMLAIEAHALDVKTGCVWTTEVTLHAMQEGGTLLGLPVDSRSVILWSRSAYGAADGNGLTNYVSGYQENHLKALVNDIHSARKRYTN